MSGFKCSCSRRGRWKKKEVREEVKEEEEEKEEHSRWWHRVKVEETFPSEKIRKKR